MCLEEAGKMQNAQGKHWFETKRRWIKRSAWDGVQRGGRLVGQMLMSWYDVITMHPLGWIRKLHNIMEQCAFPSFICMSVTFSLSVRSIHLPHAAGGTDISKDNSKANKQLTWITKWKFWSPRKLALLQSWLYSNQKGFSTFWMLYVIFMIKVCRPEHSWVFLLLCLIIDDDLFL